MLRERLVAATLAVAVAALIVAVGIVLARKPATSTAAPASPPTTVSVVCPSPALGGSLPAMVYLPAGYVGGSKRYPVVYFLHGLPASPSTYRTNAFVAHAVAASGHPAIVVAPQGAREENSDREYLDWAPDEDWPRAISVDLTGCIDHRYRTIPRRSGRALIGLSAGGFGAFNIGLRRLRTFAAVESWSGYFAATDPSGLITLDLGSPRANRRARVPQPDRLKQELGAWPSFIGFYVGAQDSRFLKWNVALDRVFTANRIPHLFRVYQGGHAGSLWARWAPLWLGFALSRLAPPGS